MTRALAPATDTQPAQWSPEQRLAAAMLEQALLDLAGKSRILRRDAEFWMTSRRAVRMNFTAVCQVLGLDAGAVRQAVLDHEGSDRLAAGCETRVPVSVA